MKKTMNIITTAAIEGIDTAINTGIRTAVIGTAVTVGASVGTKIAKGKWNLKKHAIEAAKAAAIITVSVAATHAALSVTEDVCNNIVELVESHKENDIDDPWGDEEVIEG